MQAFEKITKPHLILHDGDIEQGLAVQQVGFAAFLPSLAENLSMKELGNTEMQSLEKSHLCKQLTGRIEISSI